MEVFILNRLPPFQLLTNSQGMHDYAYQNVGEVSASSYTLDTSSSEAIPHDTLSRLFSHYGASCVRPCTTGRLRFLGKVLSVERAIAPPHDTRSQQNKSMSGNDAKPSIDDATLAKDSKQESMTKSLPALEPIAEKLGVEYPFPPHLVYAYCYVRNM